jgi:hypothetical protein
MSDFRFARHRYIHGAELGFNDVSTVGANTGTTFDVTGCSRMTLMVFFTRSSAGAVNLDLTVEAYDPGKDDWVVVNTVSTSSGVQTMSDGTIRKALASTNQKYEVRLTDLLFAKMRIKSVLVTGAAAGDTLYIGAFLGYAD